MSLLQIVLLIAGAILMLASGLLGRRIHSSEKEVAFGASPDWFKITLLDMFYAVAMMVGILAKEVWDHLNETGKVGIVWQRLIGAMIIAPIIYATVHSRFVQGELTLLGLALAFQNGFFWQAVFRTVQQSNS